MVNTGHLINLTFPRSQKFFTMILAMEKKKLTDEIDIYKKGLSKWTMIQLEIIYNYSKDSLSSIIDTTATKFANDRRRHIRDSLNSFTDRSKPYLCGTAYNEIFTNLTKDIPAYNTPHVISIDSARTILINWTNNKDSSWPADQ